MLECRGYGKIRVYWRPFAVQITTYAVFASELDPPSRELIVSSFLREVFFCVTLSKDNASLSVFPRERALLFLLPPEEGMGGSRRDLAPVIRLSVMLIFNGESSQEAAGEKRVQESHF